MFQHIFFSQPLSLPGLAYEDLQPIGTSANKDFVRVSNRYVRQQGRPAKEWVPEVLKVAFAVARSSHKLIELTANAKCWSTALQSHFGF